MNKSKIRNISKEKLQKILDISTSLSNALTIIGFKTKGYNRKTLKKIIEEYKLDLSNMKENYKKMIEKNSNLISNFKKKKVDEYKLIFCENSKIKRYTIKNIIIREKLLKFQCNLCGNKGNWQKLKLVLQLDHKNGISDDYRLENLRFLCPNCHSQTDTYAGKNKNKIKEDKKENNLKLFILNRKKDIKEINVLKFGWVSKISKKWGVSHTEVKRWIKKYYPNLKYYEREKI